MLGNVVRGILKVALGVAIFFGALFALVGYFAEKNKPARAPAAQAPVTAQPARDAAELKRLFLAAVERDDHDAAVSWGTELRRNHGGTPESAEIEQALAEAQAAAETARKTRQEEAEHARLAALWSYSTGTDNMTSATVRSARIQSTNQVEFDFPYNQPQRATLHLRRHPRHGNDAILAIERGQFQCSVMNCTVLVRFDDGQPQQYSAAGPEDHDSTVLFITNFDRFYSNLRKAKVVRIQPTIYREGGTVFEFNVAGHDPDRFAPLRGRQR